MAKAGSHSSVQEGQGPTWAQNIDMPLRLYECSLLLHVLLLKLRAVRGDLKSSRASLYLEINNQVD